MLKNSFGIKYLLVLAFLLVVPIRGVCGATVAFQIPDSEFIGAPQIYSFWDLRHRSSFFQITNTFGSQINVHVQVFNAAASCEEADFDVKLTPFQTQVFDLTNLPTPGGPVGLTGGFGFVVATDRAKNDSLLGNFRIIDDSGYEYRTNSAQFFLPSPTSTIINASEYTFNFNDVGGTTSADVVGIAVSKAGTNNVAPATVTFGQAGTSNSVLIFDDAENALSCSPATFACDATLDRGINQSIGNSQGGSRICSGVATKGFVDLPVRSTTGDFFVGFIGLNNGSSGSMDSWWADNSALITGGSTSSTSGH